MVRRVVCSFAVLASLLCGCGGAPGLTAVGTVQLDGAPLPWGQIYLRSPANEKTHEVSQGFFEVRDGVFDSGIQRMMPGPHTVTIFVHDGPAPASPASGESEASAPEPKVVGQWEGEVTLAADQPLKFDLTKADLQRVPK